MLHLETIKAVIDALNGASNAIKNEHGEVQLYVRGDILIGRLTQTLKDDAGKEGE
jgi:uncharacterized protein YxjI